MDSEPIKINNFNGLAWRNWIARMIPDHRVVGSNPTVNAFRSYGVMVITSDFESGNLGSIPSKTFLHKK